jgi:hypothetical protein
MNKILYKTVKVIYDAHLKCYDVYYKNWFIWHLDQRYRYDEDPSHMTIHYCTQEEAKERAITRAESLLKTVEVYRKSNVNYIW